MAFTFTPTEMQRLEEVLARGKFSMDNLICTFTTDPDYVATILPPCFEPDPSGDASVAIAWWEWLGPLAAEAPFYCGSVDVAVTYKGQPGTYNLAMYLSDEWGTVFGRELWGESKKRADFELTFGSAPSARITRNGVDIATITAGGFGEPVAYEGQGKSFEIKGELHPLGAGLLHDPNLLIMAHDDKDGRLKTGSGELRLASTEVDALGDLPILSMGDTLHLTVPDSTWWVDEIVPLTGGRETYAPYLYARNFDFATIASEQNAARPHERTQLTPPRYS